MKILLIHPPQWYPGSPHMAVPLLTAQLRRAGFDVTPLDLNIRFFNSILTKTNLQKAYEKSLKIREELLPFVKGFEDPVRDFDTFDAKTKTRLLRFKKIDDVLQKKKTVQSAIENVDEAVRTVKTEELFYDPEKLFFAKEILFDAMKVASLPYSPNEVALDNYFSDPSKKFCYEAIKDQCFDREINIFSDWFEENCSDIFDADYDLIALSLPDLSQVIPSFTLGAMLKKRTKAFVVFGGNYINQIEQSIKKYPEIFDIFCDGIMSGDGEKNIVSLAEFVSGKADISSVPMLTYKEQGKLVTNPFGETIDMNDVVLPDFSDYDFSDYFSPYPVLPIQLSKGCYWGRCNFCDYFHGQQGYSPKCISAVVDDIELINKKYGQKHFVITDEAIPPKYYEALAKEISSRNLEIYYYSFARLEKRFTKEVFDELYRSGARMFLWGYEAKSERVMKQMNKGIDVPDRERILKDSAEAGIWNDGLFIFGYPTETIEEIESTRSFIENDERRLIHSCTLSNFSYRRNAEIIKAVGTNGIKSLSDNGDFYTILKDEVDGIGQSERRMIRRRFQKKMLDKYENSMWPVIYSDFDHLLLYLARYTIEFVRDYRSDRRICQKFDLEDCE